VNPEPPTASTVAEVFSAQWWLAILGLLGIMAIGAVAIAIFGLPAMMLYIVLAGLYTVSGLIDWWKMRSPPHSN
jgi:hypothetical protein